MAKHSVVKIEANGTEYKVYWRQDKHNHNDSAAAGKLAVEKLAEYLDLPIEQPVYRPSTFQSNQPKPTGKNIF